MHIKKILYQLIALIIFFSHHSNADGLNLSNIKIACAERPEIIEKLNSFVKETVKLGLIRIREVNESLYSLAESRLQKKITITCEVAKGADLAGAVYFNKKIYIGSSIFDIAYTLIHQDDSSYSKQSIDASLTIYRNMIFHEFLHFFKFDNLSTKVHNNGYRADDIVYSCSYFAFPAIFNFSINFATAKKTCQDFNP